MSGPIRVLHFADAHLGMEQYGKVDSESGLSGRAGDVLGRMDEMIDYARERDVDLVVFAGDAFHSRSPNPTYQRAFARRILALSQAAPTVLLPGNHDLPAQASKASSMDIYAALGVPNIWVAREEEVRLLATKRGEVAVGAVPYPMRGRLLAGVSVAGMSIAEQDAEMERALEEKLEMLAGEAEALAGEGRPRLLVGHFSVSGAAWGSERGVMLGRDAAVGLEVLADGRWDYVALGHIHRHQALTRDWPDAPPVVYCGSLERVDFGEAEEAKGFCWVELSRGAVEWRFVETDARRMLSLSVDCRGAENPTRLVLDALEGEELAGAIVRLDVRLRAEDEALFKDGAIVEALKGAGVFHIAGVRKDVERGRRARLGEDAEGLGPLELLARYFEGRDMEAGRREELLELGRGMMGMD